MTEMENEGITWLVLILADIAAYLFAVKCADDGD